ncbi:MAG: dihydrolipoamide acetyltransferase family protein [Candidatus Dormibacteria bacterium]
MSLTVTMPQLGESVTEGTIGTWLVQPGQEVDKFDSLVEVITDKVTAEVPSPAAGTVGEILAQEGQRLSVGTPICTLEGATEEESKPAPQPDAAASSGEPIPKAGARGGVAKVQGGKKVSAPVAAIAGPMPAPAAQPAVGNGASGGYVSPAVRALADEHAVDLSQVSGTGFQGRITKRDVLLFLESGTSGPVAPAAASPPISVTGRAGAPTKAQPAAPLEVRPGATIPLSPMRRAIAEHMVRSRRTAPHAWTMVEVDMSGAAAARAARRAAFRAATGVDLAFLHFAMKSTCLALRAIPTMNATFEEEALRLQADVNLGVAVAVADGLIVPVVKGADRLSIAGLAQAVAPLIERARQGRARLEDVEGGTFTLNNAGALGTVMSQAIINQPQAAILVMDAVVRRPVVIGDAIGIRPLMNLCISFDHRINDGATAARFLGAVKASLEAVTPEEALF